MAPVLLRQGVRGGEEGREEERSVRVEMSLCFGGRLIDSKKSNIFN